jgi:hypothetical protein
MDQQKLIEELRRFRRSRILPSRPVHAATGPELSRVLRMPSERSLVLTAVERLNDIEKLTSG